LKSIVERTKVALIIHFPRFPSAHTSASPEQRGRLKELLVYVAMRAKRNRFAHTEAHYPLSQTTKRFCSLSIACEFEGAQRLGA